MCCLGADQTERVDFAVKKIRAAGKGAGTLVTSDELPFWLERGVRYSYIHSARFFASDWQMSGRCSDGRSEQRMGVEEIVTWHLNYSI